MYIITFDSKIKMRLETTDHLVYDNHFHWPWKQKKICFVNLVRMERNRKMVSCQLDRCKELSAILKRKYIKSKNLGIPFVAFTTWSLGFDILRHIYSSTTLPNSSLHILVVTEYRTKVNSRKFIEVPLRPDGGIEDCIPLSGLFLDGLLR